MTSRALAVNVKTTLGSHPSPRGRIRLVSYAGLALALAVVFFFLRDSGWQGSTQLHTLMEALAAMLAFVVGTMALGRYHSKKSNTFLFVGTGFLGTGLLDGYHAIVTSSFFASQFPSAPDSLIPWSWIASRLFLSVLMFASWWAWRREERLGESGRISERVVYVAVGALTIFSFLFFAFVPLGRAYFPEIVFHRPVEFVPALFFLLALVGYLRKGHWRHDPFEHWLVLSLIVGLMGQALFMSLSGQLFDYEFDVAHLLKKVSYLFVLIGLLTSMYQLFRQAEEGTEELARANEGLQNEISERQRAEVEQQRLVSLVENSSDFVGVASLEGQMLFLNEAGQELVGLSSLAESQAKSMYDFLMEDDLPEFRQRVLPAMMQEGRWQGEFRLKHFKTGTPIPVDMNSFTIRHPQTGEPMALATVSRDITERKRTENALRESETKFRALAETMTAAVVIVRDKHILYVNPATEAVTGYSREELLRMDFQNVIHPDSRQLMQERSASRERGEDVAPRYEMKIVAKNGETRWLDIGSSSLEFEGGAAVLVTAFDVTERQRAVEALRESETKFRSLAETVNVAVFILRGEKMLYVNPAAETLIGYTQEELLEMNFWDAVHPEVQDSMRSRAAAKQRGEPGPQEREVKIVTKAGQERWAEFRVSTIMYQGEPAILGAAFDVTERRQAEEALRASEEKYRTIFENVQDIFYQTDAPGIITEISPSVTRFGYTREELIGTSVLDIYEDPEERTQLVNALIEHGEVADYEIRLKTGDGRVVDTSISARLLRNPDGTFAGSEGAIRDITERKQAERELEEALQAERDRARRDPLTGVLNHAAIVEELRTLVDGDDAGPHAVVMIDVDGLKVMNDSYGHQAGDEALVAVATVLTRDGAIVGRYGGDEFVVALPGADRRAANIYCDLVSAKLASVRVTEADSDTTVPVQASLGLAVYPEDAATVKELIKLSDSAMYTAKRQRAAGPEGRTLSPPLRSELVAEMAEEIMPLLTSPGALKDKLRLVADRLAIGAGYDGVNFMLYSSTLRGTPVAGTRFGQVPHEDAEGWMREYDRPSNYPFRQILERTRRPIILEDPQHDQRFTDGERKLMRAVGVRSVLIAPIIWQHELIGSLSVISKREAAFGSHDAEFVVAIAAQVAAIERMATLVEELQSTSTRLALAHEETVMLLAAVAEEHDEATGVHLQGVRALADALAGELGYSEEDASATGLAAVLHDIGKIRVPKSVLTSTGLLAGDEWELIKQHTTWGAAFLANRLGFELAATIARCHHERWDGSGYPEGLTGETIPEAATIVTVADAFDAMVSDRPYRAKRPFDEAVQEIVACAGSQFNPKVVEALVRLQKRNALPHKAKARPSEQAA